MANTLFPNGLTAIQNFDGGEATPTRQFAVTAGQTIYPGDLVVLTSAGTISVASAAGDSCGVSADYIDDSGSVGGKTCLVIANPTTVFSIQATGTHTVADIGSIMNIVASAGDAVYKQSRQRLNSATVANGVQLKVVGIDGSIDNAYGLYVRLLVLIASHQFGAKLATAI